MAKKKSRDKYVSKGVVGTTKSRNKNDPTYPMKRLINQHNAWRMGKNVVLTIANPNPNETNKRFIKVNARDHWGDPKRTQGYVIKGA
jgi:hypothetical protein